MVIKLLENAEEIRKNFIDRFVLSWEEFQIRHKDWIAKAAGTRHPIDATWYRRQAFMWDKLDTVFPCVSMKEALAFLRQHDEVLIMSEDASHHASHYLFFDHKKHPGFVARVNATEIAALIEKEWFEDYRLFMENRYNPCPVLPVDLYVFDTSMKWCVVFTHETTDWDSEYDDLMKAAESRLCFICKKS